MPSTRWRAPTGRRSKPAGCRFGAREVESIPFEDGSFDGVVTVNTVYFWPDLGPGLAEVLRVLKPGGRIVVAIRDGSVMKRVSRDIFTLRAPEEVLGAISAAGFVEGRIDTVGDGARHHLVAATPLTGAEASARRHPRLHGRRAASPRLP